MKTKEMKVKELDASKNWIIDYDAVIVGGSLGGLITGAILAKNGLKIVVVENTDRTIVLKTDPTTGFISGRTVYRI